VRATRPCEVIVSAYTVRTGGEIGAEAWSVTVTESATRGGGPRGRCGPRR
jgi:hypothetical protein